jgi:hypothetical protein
MDISEIGILPLRVLLGSFAIKAVVRTINGERLPEAVLRINRAEGALVWFCIAFNFAAIAATSTNYFNRIALWGLAAVGAILGICRLIKRRERPNSDAP